MQEPGLKETARKKKQNNLSGSHLTMSPEEEDRYLLIFTIKEIAGILHCICSAHQDLSPREDKYSLFRRWEAGGVKSCIAHFLKKKKYNLSSLLYSQSCAFVITPQRNSTCVSSHFPFPQPFTPSS